VSAVLLMKDGRKQKQELYYGASFLSQSGRFLQLPAQVTGLEIKDAKGNLRRIQLN
jgi:hypothetical protein